MRHFLSLLLGLVIAPAVWAIAGYGQSRLNNATEAGLTLASATTALAVLAGAGLVYGLIAATRLSPLGPLTAGIVLLGGQVAYAARSEQIVAMAPKQVLGAEGVITLPAQTGLAAVLGGGLVMALLSIGRWRKWPKYDQSDYAFLDDAPATIGSPTPAGLSAGADDQTRAYAGATAAGGDSQYGGYGYGSSSDPGDSEQTSRLSGSSTAGAGGPWSDPPRH